MKERREMRLRSLIYAILFLLIVPMASHAASLVKDNKFGDGNEIILDFVVPVARAVAENIDNYTVFEEADPDIRLALSL